MKKYLFIALAALGFAACAEKGEENGPVQNAELEQSYVAITLAADDITRADDYVVGTDVERAVKSAYVFFFQNGDAFTVASKSSHPGNVNFVSLMDEINATPNNPDGDDMDNVSDIKDAVLVLENYKGEYPTHVVAVINWEPENKPYSLAELKAAISVLGNDAKGYVMSNSVYLNGNGETVDAVALVEGNIADNEDDALDHPITIHVERVAAKVEYPAAKNGQLFDINRTINDTVDNGNNAPVTTKVYAKITGFELYNDYENSWLIKKVDESWGLLDTVLGFNWNAVSRFRSFWATSLNEEFPENTFAWGTDDIEVGGYTYLGENTRAWTEADDVRTKVIVKAQLVKEDGVTPVEVVNWWGKDYVGEGHLLTVVANTLKNTYFVKDGNQYVGLTPADIKCVARIPEAENAYEVYFQLSDASKTKGWHKYEGGIYTPITADALDVALAAVQPALVYKNGMTYYWLDIKHLGDADSIAEYGIVRNHIYRVNIDEIDGFGTPVYDPNIAFEKPEKPEDIVTYVSAQINILSWRVVENDYDLK